MSTKKHQQFGVLVPSHLSNSRRALVTIHNILISVDLGSEINIAFLSQLMRNCEHNPSRMPCLLVRFAGGAVTAMLFKTGKLLMTGCSSEYQARIISRQFARMVQRLGHPCVTYRNFSVLSIHASCDVGMAFSRQSLAQHFQLHQQDLRASSESHFAAIQHSLPELRTSMFIFATGKVIFRTRSASSIQFALAKTYDTLVKCRAGHDVLG